MRNSVAAALTLCAVAGLGMTSAQAAPLDKIYYVPFPEDQVLNALDSLYNGSCGGSSVPANPIESVISIVALLQGTVLIYDHWEDGYEADIDNPVQSSTEIWGDGDLSNGVAIDPTTSNPYPGDLLPFGATIVLSNGVNTGTLGSVVDYDGRDKVIASQPISMTRAAWATGPDTLLAGALELYDTGSTGNWGTHFEVPVGQNMPATDGTVPFQHDDDMFEYTGLVIMADEDGTNVQVDFNDGGAVPDLSFTLNEGESYLVDGGINVGAEITTTGGDKVQVAMITGDVCANYESRWFALTPDNQWSTSYYSPVNSTQHTLGIHGDTDLVPTSIFLFNPAGSAITVDWETIGGVQTSINIPANSVVRQNMPPATVTGAHFYSADNFYAIGAVDARAGGSNSAHDWGFPLIPESLLTKSGQVGLGWGEDPLNSTGANVSPVWVTPVLCDCEGTPVNQIDICVDYNGDGGTLTAPSGVGYDALLQLNLFENARVYDPDGDQTAMRLFVCDTDTPDDQALLAIAWGQDPTTAPTGAPSIDVGTTVPPLLFNLMTGTVYIDNNPTNQLFDNPGVDEFGESSQVIIVELYKDDGDGIFEPGGDDPFYADQVVNADGYYEFGIGEVGTFFTRVRPDTLTGLNLDFSTDNEETATFAPDEFGVTDANNDFGLVQTPDLEITKNASPDPVVVGQNLTYTLTITNNGPDMDATGVVVNDPLPAGVTHVSTTPSQGSCSVPDGVICELGAIANGASATVTIVVTVN